MNDLKRIHNNFKLRRLGIDSYNEIVLFIRADSSCFQSEGFEKRSRVIIKHANRTVVATINAITSDILLGDEASLSEIGWQTLQAQDGDRIGLFHADVPESGQYLRGKILGKALSRSAFDAILQDIINGMYSDIHLASFITSCSGDRLSEQEVFDLTQAMVASGKRTHWPNNIVVDKHCIGGLPGNRTSIIVIPILATFGLTIPKTSSRAITSPAGTADTMEVFCPVNLSLTKMHEVIEKAGACIVWGGGELSLSPADDILIRIEEVLDLDSVGLMLSSVLSKKVAAGSTHVLIDMPVGYTAKVRTSAEAERIAGLFVRIGEKIGLKIRVHISDGLQPVGRGIGPGLEARDVLAILKGEENAPQDLRARALDLAGLILELADRIPEGHGRSEAQRALDSGDALKKFYAICEAQGGLRSLETARLQEHILADQTGTVTAIHNRRLAMVAKLSGAPRAKLAGVDFLCPLGSKVEKGQTMFVVHAETEGQLQYALDYVAQHPDIINITSLL